MEIIEIIEMGDVDIVTFSPCKMDGDDANDFVCHKFRVDVWQLIWLDNNTCKIDYGKAK